MLCPYPLPHTPPEPMAMSDCWIWYDAPFWSRDGSRNVFSLAWRYGVVKANAPSVSPINKAKEIMCFQDAPAMKNIARPVNDIKIKLFVSGWLKRTAPVPESKTNRGKIP